MKHSRFALWYFSVTIAFIVLENLNFMLPALIAKALIISSLMAFLHYSVRGKYDFFYKLIMTGLLFSLFGDVILQLSDLRITLPVSNDLIFIGGLGAFLVTQLIYLIAFALPKGRNSIFGSRIYQTVLVLAYGICLFYLLYPGLGELKIPVIAYTLVILLMTLSALNRFGKVSKNSYLLVAAGALLFLISDSLIAFNKFYMSFNFSGVFIMLSYVSAQYLIVLGCVRQNIGLSGHN
jgi:uncharacterized membrane protein YhhN